MTDHENRKHATPPTGFTARYSQNGIVFKHTGKATRSQAFPWGVVIVGLLLLAAVIAVILLY